jgi:hypothetical protein
VVGQMTVPSILVPATSLCPCYLIVGAICSMTLSPM